MSFISINNIWQEYGDHVVLERLNLQVKEGEFCSMVGASGCGKSTFLRLLLGQEAPSRGSITLEGKLLNAEPDSSRGVVFQRYSVFPHLNVLDNVTIGLELPQSPLCGRLFGGKKRAARARAAPIAPRRRGTTANSVHETETPSTTRVQVFGEPFTQVCLVVMVVQVRSLVTS